METAKATPKKLEGPGCRDLHENQVGTAATKNVS